MRSLFTFIQKKKTLVLLIIILLLNVFLRSINLAYPNSAVFDEAHFATYGAAYASKEASFDIHPPLGKMLYSIPLFLSPPSSYTGEKYIEYNEPDNSPKSLYFTKKTVFGTFPYISLRFLSVIFGALLVLSVFLFMQALTGKDNVALLAAFMITFENSIFLETRLILLNGMFLTFGFLGLYAIIKGKISWGGVLIGLSFAVKLMAIAFGFVGLLFIFLKSKKTWKEEKRVLKFIGSGAITFILILFVVESIWVPIANREALFEKMFFKPLRETTEKVEMGAYEKKVISLIPEKSIPYITVSVSQVIFSIGGYTISGGGGEYMKSMWYMWPFMFGSFPYYFEEGNVARPSLVLLGNPIIWGLGTSGLIIALKRLLQSIKKKWTWKNKNEKIAIQLLAFSYIFYMSLFALLVRRMSFLYHYFPALILSICLFAFLFSEFADSHTSPKTKFWLYFSVISASILGFIFISPLSYGIL